MVQYLDFILNCSLDLICKVQGCEVQMRSQRIASQGSSYFQQVMYGLSEGRNQMRSTTFYKRVLVFNQDKQDTICTHRWQNVTFNSKS